MKKRKKKNGITLLALVITIVIMLLLAGVAIQMTMGENGLIAKSVQAQKEQAKAELYDTAKLNYMSLNAKALENGQPSPQAELALSTTEFRDRYDIVGDDITDKKGTVIDTKENVLKAIMGEIPGSTTTGGSVTPGTTTPAESWPKTVGGVTIPEEDKDKMIWKLKIKNNTRIYFGENNSMLQNIPPIEVDYGNGEKEEITDIYSSYYKQYSAGEYIWKLKNIRDFVIHSNEDYEIEIVQWGKILENYEENYIKISNVSKVYEPEPDRIPITYVKAKFTEIPEWLFSKKITSKVMSRFVDCKKITNIPENLFKNCLNAEKFEDTFNGCAGLTSIPEGLFKYNVNAKVFSVIFGGCRGLTSIPEGLFKNNVNVIYFGETFRGCTGLTSIPEGLFKNNVNVNDFYGAFRDCRGLTSIPEVLFKNNVNATSFYYTFNGCTGLTNIPGGLFKNNVNANDFNVVFAGCIQIQNIPEDIIELAKKIGEKGGRVSNMFSGCTSASNYSSLPKYMKRD